MKTLLCCLMLGLVIFSAEADHHHRRGGRGRGRGRMMGRGRFSHHGTTTGGGSPYDYGSGDPSMGGPPFDPMTNPGGDGTNSEESLRNNLTAYYNKGISPKGKVTIKVGFVLRALKVLDDSAFLNGWINLEWKDPRLEWSTTYYPNITRLRMCNRRIWIPDLALWNFIDADDAFFLKDIRTPILVEHNRVKLYSPLNFYIPCDKSGGIVQCEIKIGSWTTDMTKIDLTLEAPKMDIKYIRPIRGYDLRSTKGERKVQNWPGAKNGYVHIQYTLKLGEKTDIDNALVRN